MKQTLIVLFLILFISCGGTQKPPVVTPPDPVPAPQPTPTPEPQPTPEPIQPKVKTRWLTISPYGMFASPTADFEQVAKDIYNSQFTGTSVHLLSPWTKIPGESPRPDDWPWQFKNGKFDLTKPNPFWYAKLRRFLGAFGKYGLDVEVSFVDQYCCTSTGLKAPSKVHPFRNNNLGFNWTGNPNPLYQSLTFAPLRFHHIEWKDVDEHNLKWQFFIKTPAAKAIDAYIQGVITEIAAAMKTYPNMRVGWKWANETFGTDAVGSSRGDRSEMHVYVVEAFAKKGLTPSKRFFSFVDRDIKEIADAVEVAKRRTNLHASITRTYGKQDGLGSIHEIHSTCTGATRLDLITRTKFDPNKTLFSTDGNECSKQYPNGPRDLIKSKTPWLDIKMEEGWRPEPYNPKDFMKNWRNYSPAHLELAK